MWFRNSAETLLLAVNVVQEWYRDTAVGSYVVQEKCKDVIVGSCCSSGKVLRHCRWRFMRFRKISEALLPAGDSGHGKSVVTWDGRLMCC